MEIRKVFFLILIIMCSNLYSQEKLEVGQHIYKDKLTYLSIKDNNEFEYSKYYNFSPLTIKEEREKENEPRMCGSVGYASGAKGKGKYEISDSLLVLKFTEFKRYVDKETDYDDTTKSMKFEISEFID